MTDIDFAILAPVPREHLEEAPGVSASTGHVAFGSDKWELFRDIDARRNGSDVPVLIYASHNEASADWGYVVAWRGMYIGAVDTDLGKKEEERLNHRPPSTFKYKGDNATGWGIFWKVQGLVQLPAADRRELREFQSYRTGKERENAAPRGPEVILRPHWL